MTTTTKPSPGVPLPAGAEWANEWWDDEPPHQGYRNVHGRVRAVGEHVHFNGEKGGLAEVGRHPPASSSTARST